MAPKVDGWCRGCGIWFETIFHAGFTSTLDMLCDNCFFQDEDPDDEPLLRHEGSELWQGR